MVNFFSDKRVVVTGGAGFLGSHVVRKLRQRGCATIVVPRRADCNLMKWESVCRLLEGAAPDIVIHLAGVIDNPATRNDAAASFYENLMMGVQLIEAARQQGVKKLVCIGSATSYPKFAPVPFREEDLWTGYPDEIRAPYSMAKKILLVQCQAYRQQYGFNGIYLIPTNFFGPGDQFNPLTSHVIPAFIARFLDAVRKGDPEVVCWGTGRATRDFLFVEDCAEAILLATEFYNESDPVNIGSGEEIVICDVAQHIALLVGFSGRIVWDSSKPDGQPRRWLDISRAERAFGFRPQKDLFEGLRETVEWYRQNGFERQGNDETSKN